MAYARDQRDRILKGAFAATNTDLSLKWRKLIHSHEPCMNACLLKMKNTSNPRKTQHSGSWFSSAFVNKVAEMTYFQCKSVVFVLKDALSSLFFDVGTGLKILLSPQDQMFLILTEDDNKNMTSPNNNPMPMQNHTVKKLTCSFLLSYKLHTNSNKCAFLT